jgi:hypothetical protein
MIVRNLRVIPAEKQLKVYGRHAVLMKFAMQNCLGILNSQILMIPRLRFQLVNARNDRTKQSSIRLQFFKK